ncbi:Expansin-B18 [Apostasia shenzhenica]|uniref:Expansin-B18 n=1 Tax=Apostasia shenzhenica TaxID=1088818 RepID=A0A2I0AZX5_9ASPA|nr:Expansin-B18 [Apostasia shenzhenica]
MIVSLLSFFFMIRHCSSLTDSRYDHQLNQSALDSWQFAGATWYGSPGGFGSDGGACGYGDAVGKPPYSSMVAAGNYNLFHSGEGCGACYQVRVDDVRASVECRPGGPDTISNAVVVERAYPWALCWHVIRIIQVKCTNNPLCSGNAVRVTIADECPGGPCVAESVHFDLSGTAFGALALPGKANQLLSAGVLQVQYIRVPCNYGGYRMAFHVDGGSTPEYFAVVVEFEYGDGDLSGIDLKQQGSSEWVPMRHSWGAVWQFNSGGGPLRAPFSLRLTSYTSHTSIVAGGVIPADWRPGVTYYA